MAKNNAHPKRSLVALPTVRFDLVPLAIRPTFLHLQPLSTPYFYHIATAEQRVTGLNVVAIVAATVRVEANAVVVLEAPDALVRL